MNRLISLYKSIFNTEPSDTQPITGSGSSRQYYRLSHPGNSVIGVVGTNLQENQAFIGLTSHFEARQLPVPHIIAVSPDCMAYLQSDLGTTSLYDAISTGRNSGGNYSQTEQQLLHKAIAALPAMQILGAQELDTSLCYPTHAMDSTSIHFDLNYFKYCFLKLLPDFEFNELKLEHDFCTLTDHILSLCTDTPALMLRDCQSRNIMLSENKPYFIDYQGCRLGPMEYDLASFLWQSSARYPESLRQSLIKTYTESLNRLRPTNPEALSNRLRLMVLFRLLQVLGAYGFRGYIQHKTYFLQSIPPAIDNLASTLSTGIATPYPYLKQMLHKVVGIIRSQQAAKEDAQTTPAHTDSKATPLTVTIYSFSYKRGIPADPSGNGGGYVFDCRSTHNPGRYEPYKKITGLDAPVIQFLEEDGEILTFLSHIYPLAEQHTARYVERGFNSLMLCFGCTGGQHRSVYSAQHVAQHLRYKFPGIHIHLIHREQGIDQWL